eukprot:7048811-Prymnesium_polylepis.1
MHYSFPHSFPTVGEPCRADPSRVGRPGTEGRGRRTGLERKVGWPRQSVAGRPSGVGGLAGGLPGRTQAPAARTGCPGSGAAGRRPGEGAEGVRRPRRRRGAAGA